VVRGDGEIEYKVKLPVNRFLLLHKTDMDTDQADRSLLFMIVIVAWVDRASKTDPTIMLTILDISSSYT